MMKMSCPHEDSGSSLFVECIVSGHRDHGDDVTVWSDPTWCGCVVGSISVETCKASDTWDVGIVFRCYAVESSDDCSIISD